MIFLALDTSTDQAGVAAIRSGQILAEENWHSGKNHSVELLPHLEDLLAGIDITLGQVQGIAVALGPGSYNGLRVGISTAKGLALGLGIPMAGVSTLEASAYQHAGQSLPVCALLPAGRTEMAGAVFGVTAGKWQRIVSERVLSTDSLSSIIFGPTLFCGEITGLMEKEIREQLGELAVMALNPGADGRVGSLARLGEKRLLAGEGDDGASLQPLYLHRPQITPPKTANRVYNPHESGAKTEYNQSIT